MIEETNKQPAFYTKPDATKVDTPISSSKAVKPKEPVKSGANHTKKKSFYGIVTIALFTIIALMGVLIAQRQVNRDGGDIETVAPTAPESQPKASTHQPNSCAVGFFVPYSTADCTGKTAWSDFQDNSPEAIVEGTELNIGDEFVFRITVATPEHGVSNKVVITDLLPSNLTFVEDNENSSEVTHENETITATLGDLEPNGEYIIEFKVRVNSVAANTSTNIATVYTDIGQDTPYAVSCEYQYETVEGIVECTNKQLFESPYSITDLVPTRGSLERGEEYMYRISIDVQNKSQGEVKVSDIIPPQFEYIEAMPDSEEFITFDSTNNEVVANFGERNNEELILEFRVRLLDDPEIGEFENEAFVYAYPTDSTEDEPTSIASSCPVTHSIIAIGTAECVEKKAFTDFNGTQMFSGTEVVPGQTFVYEIAVTAAQTTAGDVVLIDTLPENLTFDDVSENTDGLTHDEATNTVNMDFGQMITGEENVIRFQVQVIANPNGHDITNVAEVTTNDTTSHSCELNLVVEEYECRSTCISNSQCEEIGTGHSCYNGECRLTDNPTDLNCEPLPSPSPTPTPTPTLGCNDECSVNADCSTFGHICSTTPNGLRCRLQGNVDSESCQPQQVTSSTTPTPSLTPTPTPAPGCNETCASNADCSSINHVCLTTDDGSNKCRLETYPDSTSCTAPTPNQPVLPEVLPETGPADWLNWLKAGLVTLGVGTALFLLL